MSFTVLISSCFVFFKASCLCGDGLRRPPSAHFHPKISAEVGKMCVLLAASFIFAVLNLLRIVAYVASASSCVWPPMIISSAILQHVPLWSSGFKIFARSSSSSSDWPSSPWPLRRRNLMPPNGVAMPSHLQSSGAM